jgi:hypothetical protein
MEHKWKKIQTKEKEMESKRFESCAELRKWKKSEWSMQLSLLLTGKALDTFYGLSND